jgi:nucleoside-diphosphate-sugar epimerase
MPTRLAPISIAELAHLVHDLLAPEKPVHILGKHGPGAARNRDIPDIRKAQQQLGLSVTMPLAETIRRTGAAAQADPVASAFLMDRS